jgi:hypothetical protein
VFDTHLPTFPPWRLVAVALSESPEADNQRVAKEVAGFVRQMLVVMALRGLKNVDVMWSADSQEAVRP